MHDTHDTLRALTMVAAHLASGDVQPAEVPGLLRRLADSLESGALRLPGGLASPGAALTKPATGASPVDAAGAALVPQSQSYAREPDRHAEAVKRIFAHWQAATNHAKARLTPERARAIRARLAQKYTEQDIVTAIDGCASSEFHAGKYDDLTLICRNGEKLERFIELAGELSNITPATTTENEIATLKAQTRQARDEGRTEDYGRLNEKLRAAIRKTDQGV